MIKTLLIFGTGLLVGVCLGIILLAVLTMSDEYTHTPAEMDVFDWVVEQSRLNDSRKEDDLP